MMEEAVRYLINKDRTRERVGDERKEGKEQITEEVERRKTL